MNREIKFRGKGIADNEWYYGDLIQVESGKVHYFIIQDYEIKEERIELNTCASPEVIPETIGQYTGLHDKNGKKIYEGDIVEVKYADVKFKGIVRYDETYLAYVITNTNTIKYEFENLGDYVDYDIEVLGNKYDNPELLGGK